MLKKRIGAAVLIKDNWVVQSIGFKKYLPVGRPQIAVEFLNKWGIDEIFLVDISATKNKTSVSATVVKESAKYCRVPLAAAGGITTVQQMEELLHSGADKISLNQVLLTNKKLLTQGARLFGDQCMVAMIDFVQNRSNGSYELFDYVNKKSTGLDVLSFAKELEDAGAGEIVLQSVDRDGMYTGFEIELYKKVCSTVNIPVVALGGAGNASHFIDILQNTDVSAACAGNIFHFTEHSVNMLKAQLVKTERPIRLETGAAYRHSSFDTRGRLQKPNDQYLEDLLFIRIEKEVI
jgi:imidazole glycerol-phosphate synthase subunit HisF